MMHIVGLPRQLILLLLAAVLLVPQVSAANSSIVHITDIAWEAEGQIGKVVIQLDGPVAYRTEASSASIVVDLWQARHAQWRVAGGAHPHLPAVGIKQLNHDPAPRRTHPARPPRRQNLFWKGTHPPERRVLPPSA